MRFHTKLMFGGIALLIIPPLILAAEIMRQLSLMDPPSAAKLDLRWSFIAFYAMAGGLVMLIFARGKRKQYLKNQENQRRFEESRKTDSQ